MHKCESVYGENGKREKETKGTLGKKAHSLFFCPGCFHSDNDREYCEAAV